MRLVLTRMINQEDGVIRHAYKRTAVMERYFYVAQTRYTKKSINIIMCCFVFLFLFYELLVVLIIASQRDRHGAKSRCQRVQARRRERGQARQ